MPIPFTYNQGDVFVQALSDFWQVAFEDTYFARIFMKAFGDNLSDAYFSFIEMVLGTNIQSMPAFRKQKWTFLALKESDLLEEGKLKYGQEAEYGPQVNSPFDQGRVFLYDDSIPATFSFNLPDKIVGIETYIFNRIHNPSLSLVKDVHFVIENGIIIFSENPFDNSLVPQRILYDELGNEVDKELGLWALNTSRDYDDLWNVYGSIVDFRRDTSEMYKVFLEAMWRLQVEGPILEIFEGALNAAFSLPISRTHEELQALVDKGDNYLLLTDLNSYFIDKTVPINTDFFEINGDFKIGFKLKPYTPLTSAIEIFSKEDPHWWRNVDPLLIPARLIKSPFAELKMGDSWTLRTQPQVIFQFETVPGNSDIDNAINLDIDYKNIPFEIDDLYNITVQTAGTLGTAVLNVQRIGTGDNFTITTKSGVEVYDLEDIVGIPFNLVLIIPTDEELGRDFIVPDTDIKAHNVIGGTYGLSPEDDPPNEFFETIGVRVGGFIVGSDGVLPNTFWFNSKEYIMGNFFWHNLFYLQIHQSVIDLNLLSGGDISLIRSLIPAHIRFITLVSLSPLQDQHDLGILVVDELGVDKGVPTDQLNEEALYAKPQYNFQYFYGGTDPEPCSKIAIFPLNSIISTALNHKFIVTSGGLSATIEVRDAVTGALVDTINTIAAQTYYVLTSIDIVIQVLPDTASNGFCIDDFWLLTSNEFADSSNMGYIDGIWGDAKVGFIWIGPDFDPVWTIGGGPVFFPSLQVVKVCQTS